IKMICEGPSENCESPRQPVFLVKLSHISSSSSQLPPVRFSPCDPEWSASKMCCSEAAKLRSSCCGHRSSSAQHGRHSRQRPHRGDLPFPESLRSGKQRCSGSSYPCRRHRYEFFPAASVPALPNRVP